MSKKETNPFLHEASNRHHLWGLWVPLIIISIVIVLPIVLVYGLFYEAGHTDTGITETKPEQQVFGSIMTDMFDNCRKEEDPSIDVAFTQTQLNQLLYNIHSGFDPKITEFLKQFSVSITSDSYVFDMEISAYNLLKTHLRLVTRIQSNVMVLGERGFVFEITELKLGRLGGLRSLIPWMSSSFGFDLTKLFKDAGLSLVYDEANCRLLYPYSYFINDIKNLTKMSDGLFINLFSSFFNGSYVEFTHIPNDRANGKIALENFRYNPEYTNSNYTLNPDVVVEGQTQTLLTAKANDIVKMLNDGIINNSDGNPIEAKVNAMHQFLCYGKDYLDSSELNYINGIYNSIKADYCGNKSIDDYSKDAKEYAFGSKPSVSIMNELFNVAEEKVKKIEKEEGYSGIIEKIIADNQYFLYDSANPLVLSDSRLHEEIKDNKQIVGYGYSFATEVSANNYKVNYTMIDNLYATIKEGKGTSPDVLSLVFGLNINGTETSLILPMEASKVNKDGTFGLKFSIESAKMFYGNDDFSIVKPYFTDLMKKMDSFGSFITIDKNDTGEVTGISMLFNFHDYIIANPTSEFAKLHTLATGIGAKLQISVDMVDSATSTAGKVSGEFHISMGYVK